MKLDLQRGAVAILVALLLPALIGLMALGVDVGYVLVRRQQMQVAADAAALLAAGARQHGEDISTATALAHIGTAANGFRHNINSTVVSISMPPGGSRDFAADTQYVRVTLAQPVNAFLAWVFGITQTNTSATAVAGPVGSGGPCLLTLGTTGSSAFSLIGNSTVIGNACGIFINSRNAKALNVSGNATVHATPIQVVGGYSATGNVDISPVTTGASTTADPFAKLAMPVFNTCTYTNYSKSGNGSLVLNAGTYCGGITISGNYAVSFNPGIYVLQGGGMNLTGNLSSVTGTDITIYNSGNGGTYPYSSINMSGNVALNLSAPTTGTYAGLLIMQNKLNTKAATLVGNSGATLAGNLYFPKNTVVLTGNSSTNIPTGSVVAQKVSITGNTKFSMTNTYGTTATGSARTGLYQ